MIAFDVMGRGVRLSYARVAIVGLVALLVGAPLACGSLLGIDSGTLRGDASTMDINVFPEDVSSSDGAVIEDSGTYSDTYVPAESGPACTPDLNWCESHCGSGPDNCGQMRGCGSECPQGESCTGNVCTCAISAGWCTGRCGMTTDNCGNPIDCMTCDGGASCYSNACGCMPEAVTTTCAGKQCGAATNNCNLTVNCGVSNTTECASGDYCKPDETCCTPDNSACNGRCQTSITNNCGQPIQCPKTCANSGVCNSTVCCNPTGCGGNCVDNCGTANSSCCVTTSPDSGSPPQDSGSTPPVDSGGGCNPYGATCSGGCCSQQCGYNFTCVTACKAYGGGCSSPSDCCYGLSCSGVASPASTAALGVTAQGISPFDGGIVQLGTCQ